MKTKFTLLIGIVALCSCGKNPSVKSEYDKLLATEVQQRIDLLKESQKDTIYKDIPDAEIIHREVNDLILLTKDVENADLVIKKVNDYFLETASKYNVTTDGVVTILKTMTLATIESTIITNELNLLDKIIFTRISIKLDSTGMRTVY